MLCIIHGAHYIPYECQKLGSAPSQEEKEAERLNDFLFGEVR